MNNIQIVTTLRSEYPKDTQARAVLSLPPVRVLIGAATVMGRSCYGAGHVWAGRANFYLHDHDICNSPPDEAFIDMLAQNCRLAGPHFGLHLIVEDLCRGITTPPGQKRSQTNCGLFGIVIILVELVHSDPVALNLH